MPNAYFQFQQFKIDQAKSGMKVTTDACLFGAWVVSEISREDGPNRILDIGTGTGLLSLMLAQKTKLSIIDAVEINELAFEEAQSNFKQSNWKDRLNAYQSAIQNFSSEHQYDTIISNPPFFAQSQKGLSVSKNQALHASDLLAEELLISIGKFLTENGSFYLLFPEREMDQFIELAETRKLYLRKLVTVRNKEGQNVFRKMATFTFRNEKTAFEEKIIRRPDGKYTDGFWSLLKSYYLDYNNPSL